MTDFREVPWVQQGLSVRAEFAGRPHGGDYVAYATAGVTGRGPEVAAYIVALHNASLLDRKANDSRTVASERSAPEGFRSYMHKLYAHWQNMVHVSYVGEPLMLRLWLFAEWLHETRHMDVVDTFEALVDVGFGLEKSTST